MKTGLTNKKTLHNSESLLVIFSTFLVPNILHHLQILKEFYRVRSSGLYLPYLRMISIQEEVFQYPMDGVKLLAHLRNKYYVPCIVSKDVLRALYAVILIMIMYEQVAPYASIQDQYHTLIATPLR